MVRFFDNSIINPICSFSLPLYLYICILLRNVALREVLNMANMLEQMYKRMREEGLITGSEHAKLITGTDRYIAQKREC